VAADAEGWGGVGDSDGVVEGWAGGHEGCGGEDACVVELGDGAVDARGEAEVVCVDDEAGGHEIDGSPICVQTQDPTTSTTLAGGTGMVRDAAASRQFNSKITF